MLSVKHNSKTRITGIAVGIALLSGCGGSSETTDLVNALAEPLNDFIDIPIVPVVTPVEPAAPTTPVATGLISGVSSGGEIGQYRLGSPPASVGSLVLDPLNDGSDVFIIAGGSTELSVASAVPFTVVYVLSDSNGYFQLSLSQAVQAASVVVSFTADTLAAGQRQVDVSVGDATGNVSALQSLAVQSVEVGTGEVQVSVSWDKPTDVDLWLIEPDGEKIYYANENSDNGGSLDLDSNAGCGLDNVNNENITYEGVTAPSGEYVVIVDYYLACGVNTPTNYTVTIRAGGLTNTYSGQLTNAIDNVEVARFQIR